MPSLFETLEDAEHRVGVEVDTSYSTRPLRTYARMTADPIRFLWMWAQYSVEARARVQSLADTGDRAARIALASDFPEIAAELAAGGQRKLQAQRQIMHWVGTRAMLYREEQQFMRGALYAGTAAVMGNRGLVGMATVISIILAVVFYQVYTLQRQDDRFVEFLDAPFLRVAPDWMWTDSRMLGVDDSDGWITHEIDYRLPTGQTVVWRREEKITEPGVSDVFSCVLDHGVERARYEQENPYAAQFTDAWPVPGCALGTPLELID